MARDVARFCAVVYLSATAWTRAEEAPISSILVPIMMPINALESALEAAIPTQDAGKQQVDVGPEVPDGATLSWNLRRSPIDLVGKDGELNAQTTMSGRAGIAGTIKVLRGDLGRLLGDLNPTSVPLSVHADLAADAGMRIAPRLTSDWRVEAEIHPAVTLRDADVRILGIPFSVRSLIQPQLDKQVDGLVEDLRDKLAQDTSLEEAAREAWDNLCRAHPLEISSTDKAAEPPAPVWLIVEPLEAHAVQPIITDEVVTLAVGLSARLRLSDQEDSPTCIPLPDLTLGALDPGVRIALPVTVSYARIDEELRPLLIGQPLNVGTTGVVMTPTGFEIGAGSDGRLRVAIEAEAELPGVWEAIWSYFRGSRVVGIDLETRPQLDRENQTMSFTETRIAATSDDFANVLGQVAALAQARLVSALEQAAHVDLSAESDRARARADRAVAAADPDKLGGLNLSKATLTRLTLKSVAPGRGALEATAVAEGELSVTLPTIELD